jgi:hypothetical protein
MIHSRRAGITSPLTQELSFATEKLCRSMLVCNSKITFDANPQYFCVTARTGGGVAETIHSSSLTGRTIKGVFISG